VKVFADSPAVFASLLTDFLEAFGSLLLALARARPLLRARIDEEQEAFALSE
jgi:hypothetical protein